MLLIYKFTFNRNDKNTCYRKSKFRIFMERNIGWFYLCGGFIIYIGLTIFFLCKKGHRDLLRKYIILKFIYYALTICAIVVLSYLLTVLLIEIIILLNSLI